MWYFKGIMNPKEKDIDEVLTRGISYIFPSKEELKKRLLSGEKLRVYLGADATGPELHLGHAKNFIVLEKIRRLGHEALLLFGDFTARIGDPTDKAATRRRLSKEEVERNLKDWEKQAGRVLDFNDSKNPAKIMRNTEWLENLTFNDVIDLAANVTVQQMIERDMFEKRIQEKKPIYLHEFLYPLMQGYDSVAMDVDAEIGGSDQLFNMLVGRDLQKKYHDKEKFVITTALLEDPKTGKKLMSKSEGEYIAISDAPADMYGKAMALPDEAIIQIFTDCTWAPLEEIGEYENALKEGENPRNIKMKLAREIVKTYHNERAAEEAERAFVAAFQEKKLPEEVEEITAHHGDFLGKTLVGKGILKSNAEFRRLVEEGAVRVLESGEKIEDHTFLLTKGAVFKIGKRRFVRITIE